MNRRTVWFLSLFACSTLMFAQTSTPVAVVQEQGKAVFRSNCAFCHGATGKGGRGPSLATARMSSMGDPEVLGIIKNGVPGTNMPAFASLDKEDLEPLVIYLRTLAGAAGPASASNGDVAAGITVYRNNGCVACHRIGIEGGIYGPELTRVGSGRSEQYLRESIISPSADVPQEYEGVIVTTAQGKKVKGIRINEDTFTVQLRLLDGKIATFDKTKARAVDHPKESFMPAYKLADKDLDNLLAYLETLRGPVVSGADAEKAKGIK